MGNVRILFVAANPRTTERHVLEQEVREIEGKIQSARYRSEFEFGSLWAARSDDLIDALERHRPHVVHFSGGGGPLHLAREDGEVRVVPEAALQDLFRVVGDDTRVVVLNGCYSELQAEAIAASVDCVVGVPPGLGDEAARGFSAPFYRALAYGRSVQNGFEQGRVGLQMLGFAGASPRLVVKRDGVVPDRIVLVTLTSSGPVAHETMVRRVTQHLERGAKMGVALLEPLGFAARAVVHEVMVRLERPGEELIPVWLAPDLSIADESSLYARLTRDLWAGLRRLPEGSGAREDWLDEVGTALPEAGRGEPGDDFVFAVEYAIAHLDRYGGRRLVLVVDDLDLMNEAQKRRWASLLLRFRGRLKLLVWGGLELYRLIVEPPARGLGSAFHHLERINLECMGVSEVEWRLGEWLGVSEGRRLGASLHRLTGGHPALIEDVIRLPPGFLAGAPLYEVEARVLCGLHMDRLRRELAEAPALVEALRGFVAHRREVWTQSWDSAEERKLRWLGLIVETEGRCWRWAAPLLRRLAEEL
ncbi:hypothetical protein [Haliangium sp.]|uniref:hypothetical protein n=1 Tax=Haliangium sp. TaxID=2663208 RepID=UPI003D0D3BB2